MVMKIIFLSFLFSICCIVQCLSFLNQWAVKVPKGISYTKTVARLHGFNFLHQVTGLKNVYLLSHQLPLTQANPHHLTRKLQHHPFVTWVEHQIIKKRSIRQATVMNKGNDFNDPLWRKQWYLNKGALGGFDMNVQAAWVLGYSGKNVVVSILEDGVDYLHSDLKSNYDKKASYDFIDDDDDPLAEDENYQGTRCAGQISAQADNNICNVGLAYNARFGAIRVFNEEMTDVKEGASLAFKQQYIHIYTASWGPEDDGKTIGGPGPLAAQSLAEGAKSGRQGLGNIFVWGSGSGGRMDSCAMDGYANSLYTITVGSVTQGNRFPIYAEECASILASTYSSGSSNDLKIATTDMNNKCTVSHEGELASTSFAAGIMALTLEANSNLTWRDMQHIIVLTANTKPFVVHPKWITNAGGRRVSSRFGFGLMDAGLMVKLARIWRRVPELQTCKWMLHKFDVLIENSKRLTVDLEMEDLECRENGTVVNWIEKVELFLNIDSTKRGSLLVELESPSGTKSVMLPRRNLDLKKGPTLLHKWPLMSVQFWRERPKRAAWRLHIQVEDGQSAHLNWVQLVLYGTKDNPVRLKSPKKIPDWFKRFQSLSSVKRSQVDSDVNHFNNNRIPCHPLCRADAGCVGQDPDQCHSCSKVRSSDGITCLPECPISQVKLLLNESDEYRCLPCASSCATCSLDKPNYCTSCVPSNVLLGGTCVKACPPHYYVDGGKCLPCAAECSVCTGPTELNCSKCRAPLKLVNGRCQDLNAVACLKSQYVVHEPVIHCANCHVSCATCRDGNLPENCLSCKNGAFLAVGQGCSSNCPMGFFPNTQRNDQLCVACALGCATCTGPEPRDCTACLSDFTLSDEDICVSSCPNGQYRASKYYVASQCLPCDSSCESCSGPSASHCLSCPAGKFRWKNQCDSKCPQRTFANKNSATCEWCHVSCASCKASGSRNCILCAFNYRNVSNRCVPLVACSVGQFNSASGECKPCHLSCRSCFGPGSSQCKSCRRNEDVCFHQNSCFKCCQSTQPVTKYCRLCKAGNDQCLNKESKSKAAVHHHQYRRGGDRLIMLAVLLVLLIVGFGVGTFFVLQARSQQRFCWTPPYRRVPHFYKKEDGTSMSALQQRADAESDIEDEEVFSQRKYSKEVRS